MTDTGDAGKGRAGTTVAPASSDAFLRDVLEGLSHTPKTIPPKYFYDRRGSALFDEITELEEYYPTRTELSILESRIEDVIAHTGRHVVLIEYGSGSSRKTRLILDKLAAGSSYVPIDISETHLLATVEELARAYPELTIHPVHADYSDPVELPDLEGRRYVFYPGSTIGNFEPARAVAFLTRVGGVIGPSGGLLIGVDLRKSPSILEAAYDDSRGVTAAFNLNLLDRINRELRGKFDPGSFAHRAIFSANQSRVEMHLVSMLEQDVSIGSRTFRFAKGEYIHTESSYKYTLGGFESLASEGGLVVDTVWTDRQDMFAVFLMRNRAS